VHAETWPTAKWASEEPPRPEAEITVLAQHGTGLQVGARLVPLTRALARQRAVVGAEVAVTAALLDQLPLPRSVVVVVPPDVDASSCVDSLLPAATALLGRRALTVTVTCPFSVPHGPGGALSMYNQHTEALPEAFVEAVAGGRRCGLVTPGGNAVLVLQEFVPAIASAVVQVSPDRTAPVCIDGRWGLAEQRSAADTFEVPADGVTVHSQLAWKPTASLAAAGGTRTMALPAGWQHRHSLGRDTIRQLAALSRDAAVTAGAALSLDIVLGRRGPVVLRCRLRSV
jgi:hypothetical protein